MADRITGAEALIRSLEHENVELIFGYPGGCILPAYDPLMDSPIRHVLVRHEQGAGHMAEGYAHVSGKPGVAMVTSGPAATNLVTPLMDAYMDSVPMVAITGQVPTAAIGSDAFQECDTVGITRSCTKHNELVMSAQDIPMAVRQAFHIATTGRPGPTLIDVPKDCLQNEMEWYWPTDQEVLDSLPGLPPEREGSPADDQGGRPPDHGVRAPGHLCRRWDPQGSCGRSVARAGRADRQLRRHHAHGPWRVPRQSPAVPRACPGCTATPRRSRRCRRPIC